MSLRLRRTTKRKVRPFACTAATCDGQLIRCISTDGEFLKSLQVNLSRLIAYAESADIGLQREVGCVNLLPFVTHV